MCDSGAGNYSTAYSNSGAAACTGAGASAGPIRQSEPRQTIEEIRSTRTIQVPVTRTIKTQVPVQRAVKTQVPVQRAVHGTKEVVTHVTVNKQKTETYTKMVPVQATRVVTVPTVEKRVQQVPTVNYVTEMQEKIEYVTEMKEQVNTVTEYETRTIPTIAKRIITRYETVEETAPVDAPEASSGSNGLSNSPGSAAINNGSASYGSSY